MRTLSCPPWLRPKKTTNDNKKDHKWNTTWTVTPLGKITEEASLLISHSRSTIFDKKVPVRLTYTTQSQYMIRKNTQVAEFSVVNPEQSKFIEPKDMAVSTMIPECDPDLTTYLKELLKTNKPEQQNNTLLFPTPANPGKNEDHTPIQTRSFKEENALKEQQKLNPTDKVESRKKLIPLTHCSPKLKNKQ